MISNLERLGIQLGCGQVDPSFPLALRGAQKDFLTIHARMQPLRERAEALTAIANDLANLRAAFRGVHDSEFGLRLGLFAWIVFPLTLVAGIFSMNEHYLPGAKFVEILGCQPSVRGCIYSCTGLRVATVPRSCSRRQRVWC
jgi:hypothetical protein